MSKKNKKQLGYSENNQVVGPVVVNMDILAYASDVDLRSRNDQLERDRERAYHNGYDPYQWEVEICYVQRELDLRQTRAMAHMNYLRNNPETVDTVDASDSPDMGQKHSVN